VIRIESSPSYSTVFVVSMFSQLMGVGKVAFGLRSRTFVSVDLNCV